MHAYKKREEVNVMDLELNRGVSPTQNIFQNGIWWFIVLINLGYIMIWLMMPTNTFFMDWLPHIQAKADPIYFGKQGTTILVYTFPIIFIATLACLYHHLMQKASNHSTESKIGFFNKASWRKPLLVNGPLGIISKIEFSFIIMFVLLLIWSLCSYLHGMFAKVALQAAYEREQVWEAKLKNSALALGFVGNIFLAFLLFPVSRGSSILRFLGLTSEASIKYHIWLGHIAMTLFTAHGLCYVSFWDKTHQTAEIFKWSKVGISNVAGVVALLAGLTMWAATLPRIRRKFFELFFYIHHLYIVFVVFFVLHVGFSYSCIMLPGFYLFLVDRYLRFLQSQQKIQLVSARVLPCEAVELNFSKNPGLSYAPTSIIFINIASISKLQWHPFSITSCSNTDFDTLSIVIKSTGKWSHTLFKQLSTLSPPSHLDVSIEGPYGPASTFFSRHETLVMVSGGSGITPFISIIRSLLFKANNEGGKSFKVLLICSFKKSIDLTMIDLLLPVSGTTLDTSRLQLQIEAYVTREKQTATTNDRKLLQTLWFKSNALDEPISAVFGQNNWLYLGIIITTSFILFLLIIAVLTRYYIYPIDHNSDLIYPYFLRSILSMLFVCVSIVIAATSVFLWNKKQNKALTQIKNTSTPTTSPGSVNHKTDRELESLPLQSLIQTAKIHYGERPDIKKILSNCDGSSIGVLVSGPRKMRHEVASICTSCSTDNLHFESISFSW
ncbi:ferric reduction oxidase 2-like [Trifolium pratense]|uniref:ferric reduction oxidase 2-like n=1 Tax=Trifolium pratense TaxID=57577 RepID=UPI001E69080D|nr:ferric reduction oxidase 2-like [Trifolium pratense]